ncbi:MAG: hypothetical protein IPN79_19085 [Saprospiraceae bacterium]|jgi:hypothetical protein|nr:hypothetical protein [Saprospiraceae bacterium]
MNSKILNSIYYGELKPWLINFDDERELKETIRAVSKMPFASISDYENRLKVLLQQLPSLQQSFSALKLQILQPLHYATSLPEPSSLPQHFFKAIIEAEKIRYYNETLANPFIKDNALDVPYQIGEKSLKGIAILANELNNELALKEFEANDLSYFSLLYLRNSLIELYFSIQESFKEHLSDVYENIDDFYLYKMDDDTDKIVLKQLSIGSTNFPSQIKHSTEKQKLSFGWKHNSISSLEGLFNDLCIDYTFLIETNTPIDTLIILLTSKDIKPGEHLIYLGCPTTLFVFVMDNLSKHFQRLTPTNIVASKSFITKTNKEPIKADNYYKTSSKSKIKEETKEAILDLIQKYFP